MYAKIPVIFTNSAMENNGIETIKQIFSEEWGIKVAYKDGYLVYDGDTDTQSKVSTSARESLINELKETDADGNEYISNHGMKIGYGLRGGTFNLSKINWGANTTTDLIRKFIK